ncbi:hypothetical protein DVK44_00035 [Streptomyces paludis]|uniref:Pectate lyase domain-containing protein n=1 Tax=Streptomyces paludis TaxID=2282738 RepID=A0A345HI06_9ACTN|nr:hypothetical protein DVK44_00035 [Streptomyces paludis]
MSPSPLSPHGPSPDTASAAAPPHRRSRLARRTALLAAAAVVAAGLGAIPLAAGASAATDLAHQTLPAKDGWAASGTGTTGGAAATQVVTVSTRAQLVAALGSASSTTPRIIQVKGTINANTDDAGAAVGCADYASGTGYSLSAYLKAYDPATWGRTKVPSGTQETARVAAAAKQAKNIQFNVPSNTTLVGVPGSNARILGGALVLKNVDNVIVRNLTFNSPEDCFPQWDPTDGSTGNWNSEYDAVTLRGATHVWVDHNTFSDGPTLDSASATYFDRKFQVHDGLLDITKGSDLVTVERNRFTNHDKTTLIGSSDTDNASALRISIHHNVYTGITQRAPLTRIGQVHIYNNYYDTTKAGGYAHSYTINSRAGAQVVAEKNYWKLSSDRKTSQLLSGDGTGAIAGSGNMVDGTVTDLAAAYNAAADSSKQLKTAVNWTPTLTAGLESSAKDLPSSLAATAGAGILTAAGTTSTAAAAPVAAAAAAPAVAAATRTVAADGSAQYRTVQAAVDASAAGDTVSVAKGTYREVLNVPTGKTGLTIRGATGNAEDVVITYDNAAGTRKPDGTTYGTRGSATATFAANDLTVTGVTLQNTWLRAEHPEITDTQAVAVTAQGDRQIFRNVRVIGHQDTLLTYAPNATGQYRQYFRNSFISGDVDFLFGNATAVFDRVNITLRDRGAAAGGNNGYLAAPNTNSAKKYGMLITGSTISSSAQANTFSLGRPWHPTDDAVGQLVIRNTALPAAIRVAAPWTDFGTFPWRSARFHEYANTGPGATVNANRPQLTAAQAGEYTAAAYLAGTDGWNPTG